MYINTI